MKEENLEVVLAKLEGLKTRIKYRSSFALGKLLFNNIIQYYLPKKDVFYVIYSELKCRKLYRLSNLPGLTRYDAINVIKIGKTDFVPFGKLYKLIPETENIDAIFDELTNMIPNLPKNSVVILCGFDMLVALENLHVLKKIRELYESIPDITLFMTMREGMCSDVADKVLEDIHDNNLSIQQQEFSDVVIVTIEESVLDISSFVIS